MPSFLIWGSRRDLHFLKATSGGCVSGLPHGDASAGPGHLQWHGKSGCSHHSVHCSGRRPPKYRGGGCAKSQRVAGGYDMLSLLWGPPCVLLYFILTTRLRREEIQLADGKTQAQKGQGACPRSHSWEVGKLGIKPRSFPRGRPLGCHMIWLKIIWMGTRWPA